MSKINVWKSTFSIITSILGTILFISCQGNLFYTEYKDINSAGWDSQDTLIFEIPQSDTDQDVNLTIATRATNSYNYKELVLWIEHSKDSKRIFTDIVNLSLYDKYGKAEGHGFPYVETEKETDVLHLKKGHKHIIKVTHRMRHNPLQGIENIGITLMHNK